MLAGKNLPERWHPGRQLAVKGGRSVRWGAVSNTQRKPYTHVRAELKVALATVNVLVVRVVEVTVHNLF